MFPLLSYLFVCALFSDGLLADCDADWEYSQGKDLGFQPVAPRCQFDLERIHGLSLARSLSFSLFLSLSLSFEIGRALFFLNSTP